MWSSEVLSRIRSSHRGIKSMQSLSTSSLPISSFPGRGPLSLRFLEGKGRVQKVTTSANRIELKGVSNIIAAGNNKSSSPTGTASSSPSQDGAAGFNAGRVFLGVAGGLGMASGGYFAGSQLTTDYRDQRLDLLDKHLRVAAKRRAEPGTLEAVLPVEEYVKWCHDVSEYVLTNDLPKWNPKFMPFAAAASSSAKGDKSEKMVSSLSLGAGDVKREV